MRLLVTIVLHLVTANDVLEAIALQEALCDVRAELNADATFAGGAAALRLWIRP